MAKPQKVGDGAAFASAVQSKLRAKRFGKNLSAKPLTKATSGARMDSVNSDQGQT